jgi:hypothetical protein
MHRPAKTGLSQDANSAALSQAQGGQALFQIRVRVNVRDPAQLTDLKVVECEHIFRLRRCLEAWMDGRHYFSNENCSYLDSTSSETMQCLGTSQSLSYLKKFWSLDLLRIYSVQTF